MWSVTINRKVVLWRKASDKNVANFIDKLVINLVFSETKDALDTVCHVLLIEGVSENEHLVKIKVEYNIVTLCLKSSA